MHQLPRRGIGQAEFLPQQIRKLIAQAHNGVAPLAFRFRRARRKVVLARGGEFLFQFRHHFPLQVALFPQHAGEGVRRDDLGFQIWKRTDAAILLGPVRRLAHHQGNEKAQLRYLHGDGLNVHAVNALLDKMELARIIAVLAVRKIPFKFRQFLFRGLQGGFALDRVRDCARGPALCFERRPVPRLPKQVLWVQLLQHMHQLGQHSHQKRARPAGRVQNLEAVNRLNQRRHLDRTKPMRQVVPRKKLSQA